MPREEKARPVARSYHQFCGVARALDVVGERWTLLLVRDLLLGPRRYGDLAGGLPGLTTNLLAKRLHEMEARGLIAHRTLPPPAPVAVYELTEAGRALEPVVMALGAWGFRSMDRPRRDERFDIAWALLSMKRRYRGVPRGIVAELEVDGALFQYRMKGRAIELQRGRPWEASLRIVGTTDAVRSWLVGRVPRARLGSRVAVEGPREARAAFSAAFELR